MDNSKKGEQDEVKSTADEENPNNNNINTINVISATSSPPLEPGSNVAALLDETETENQSRRQSSRTPFNDLSQVDADLALARTLQDQERAYMMLRMNGNGRSIYGTWAPGSYSYEDDDDFENVSDDSDDDDNDDDDDDDEDAFDVHAHAEAGEDDPGVQLDHADFPSDEAYARALQDAEDIEMAARLLALARINDTVSGEDEDDDEDTEDDDVNSQDTWEEVDPDELSYEELLALGEVIGTESRGLSSESIASLPSMIYKPQSSQAESSDPCVICRLDYEDGDTLTVLACKHSYHSECINNWLQINKVCPVCSTEVSTSGNS